MRDVAELPMRAVRFVHRRRVAKQLGIYEGRLFRKIEAPSGVRFRGTLRPLRMPENDPTVLSPLVEVLLDDCYGVRRLKNAQRILDIGGHVGLFSLTARIEHPSAQIHCYEPNPRLWPYLSQQAVEFGFNAFPEAVGGCAGQVSMEYRETDGEGSIHSRVHEDEQGSVLQIPFDEAVERMGGTIDLAKVDCEGCEWSFFDSAAWDRVDRVAAEYHLWPDHAHEDARNALERLCFKIVRHSPHDGYGLIWGATLTLFPTQAVAWRLVLPAVSSLAIMPPARAGARALSAAGSGRRGRRG